MSSSFSLLLLGTTPLIGNLKVELMTPVCHHNLYFIGTLMKKTIIASTLFLLFVLPTLAAPSIRVMLLDGESGGPYHKWQLVTPVLKKQLEENQSKVMSGS